VDEPIEVRAQRGIGGSQSKPTITKVVWLGSRPGRRLLSVEAAVERRSPRHTTQQEHWSRIQGREGYTSRQWHSGREAGSQSHGSH
jgi:hypothetical protein